MDTIDTAVGTAVRQKWARCVSCSKVRPLKTADMAAVFDAKRFAKIVQCPVSIRTRRRIGGLHPQLYELPALLTPLAHWTESAKARYNLKIYPLESWRIG